MFSLRSLGIGVVGACAIALGSATTAAGTTTPAPANAQLKAFLCQKAVDPPARALSIQAVMRPVTGTSKMQMKFDLMRQTKAHPRFAVVHGKGLGSWLTPDDPTLGQRAGDVWIVNHPVVDLAAPATYKFRVTFRWIGAQGQTLSTAVQSSSACYQPELRPDLFVKSLTANPITSGGGTGQWAYVATIANRGLTGAAPVEVDFADGGSAPVAATVASVGARSTARQRFVAPACVPGATLTVTVDPKHTNDEYTYANNVLTAACPAPSTS
jgi:CARDB